MQSFSNIGHLLKFDSEETLTLLKHDLLLELKILADSN